MWVLYSIIKKIMTIFNLIYSDPKINGNFIIAAFSFIISLILPLFLGFDFFHIMCIQVILLFHEMGHYYAMKYFKFNDIKIIFYPLMAFTKTTSTMDSRFNKIVVSLAGPLPGILIGSLFLLFENYLPDKWLFFIKALVYINTFNLIPVALLDGGNIFECLFISDSNKRIGIFHLITGTGSAIVCIASNYYAFIWLCLLIAIRVIVFFKHRMDPPILKFNDTLNLKDKILFSVIWTGTIIIAIISRFWEIY